MTKVEMIKVIIQGFILVTQLILLYVQLRHDKNELMPIIICLSLVSIGITRFLK